MRSLFIVGLLAVVFVAASKAQTDEADVLIPSDHQSDEPIPSIPAVHHFRQKRATCDLLSIFNVNHAACALHCVGHGYRGGYCSNKAVCTCRK